jgi:hypothetical protein
MASNTAILPTPNLQDFFPNHELSGILKDHFDSLTLVNRITHFVKLIPEFEKLRTDPHLTTLIRNIIEDEINNKEIDKDAVLMKALQSIFPDLTASEVNSIQQQIPFLQTFKLIKGIPLSKKLFKSTTRWIFRKIG